MTKSSSESFLLLRGAGLAEDELATRVFAVGRVALEEGPAVGEVAAAADADRPKKLARVVCLGFVMLLLELAFLPELRPVEGGTTAVMTLAAGGVVVVRDTARPLKVVELDGTKTKGSEPYRYPKGCS